MTNPLMNRTCLLAAICLATIGVPPGASAQVTFDRILNSSREPQNWLTYSGDYSGRRFSELRQINTDNVKTLAARWVYQTGALGKFEKWAQGTAPPAQPAK